jgi:hypothetical protein
MKTNKVLTKVVAGTVSASIMVSSCAPAGFQNPLDEQIYRHRAPQNQDLGEIAIPIDVQLTSDEAQYILFLCHLTAEIVDNPEVAQEFANNPKEFINKFGYEKDISLDESLLNLILSLADEEINSALNDNDIQKFYYLCKQKNLLSLNNSYFKDISSEQIQRIADELGIKINESRLYGIEQYGIFPVGFICVAALIVYIVTHNEIYVTEEYEFRLQYNNNLEKLLVDSNPVLTVWTLKDKDFATPILVDMFLEDQINEMIDIIKQENPDFFKSNSEDYMRNLLKINISNKQL